MTLAGDTDRDQDIHMLVRSIMGKESSSKQSEVRKRPSILPGRVE